MSCLTMARRTCVLTLVHYGVLCGPAVEHDMADREYSTDPLNDAELREIRRIIETQRRTEWFFATIRVWAMWIAAVLGGAYVLLAALRDGIKALGGK